MIVIDYIKRATLLMRSLLFFLAILIFALIISYTKIVSVTKIFLDPIYRGELPSLLSVGVLPIALYGFYMAIKKKFLQRNRYVFSTVFGTVLTIVLFENTPYWQYANSIALKFSSSIYETYDLKKNKMISAARGNYMRKRSEVLKYYTELDKPEIELDDMPYIAMSLRLYGTDESRRYSDNIWVEYLQLIEKDASIKDKTRRVRSDYRRAFYANTDDIINEKELGQLTVALIYEIGYEVEKDVSFAEKLYQGISDEGFVYADLFLKSNNEKIYNKISRYYYL